MPLPTSVTQRPERPKLHKSLELTLNLCLLTKLTQIYYYVYTHYLHVVDFCLTSTVYFVSPTKVVVSRLILYSAFLFDVTK